ncbi:MAG: ADOP family duplicated permease, partial [Gemmatimonadaceae bacterium]
AARGRTFDGSEDASIGVAPVVTISHGYWTRHFNQDSSIVGKEVVINGARLTIIGVTPSWFTGEIVGQSTDVWLPLTMQPVLMPKRPWLDRHDTYWLLLLGRTAPGVSFASAKSTLERTIRDIVVEKSTDAASLARAKEVPVYVSPGAKGLSGVRRTFGAALMTLMVGVGLLILIICANVANLLLARAVARSREMSVRLALGAGQGRLMRQLLTESLLLGLIAAAAGLGIARWGSRLLLTLVSDGTSAIPIDVGLDWSVLAFTLALSLVTVVLFGLVPALKASRLNVASTLRASTKSVTGAQGSQAGRVPIGRLLIAAQVALSLVLLVGAALLVRSLRSVEGVDTGLDRDHLLIVEMDPTSSGYTGERLNRLAAELGERLGRLPGVAAVTYSENGIFSGTESASTFQIPGFVARAREDTVANYDHVGPGYVRAVGARLLLGRELTPNDAVHGAPVVMVNATMARFYFGAENPIGRTMQMDSSAFQIVGVVADVKDHVLRDAGTRRFYMPFQQATEDGMSLRMIVRASGDPASLAIPVRHAIKEYDALLRVSDIQPLTSLMRDSIREDRLLARIAAGFGLLALLLAAVGLYGVMTYAIARRTSEIGLRVALGARRGNVIGMVLGDALKLVAGGVAVGVPLALGAARLLRSQLFGVGPTDPASIILALTVLTASAVLAALIPAIRAARVAPLIALRQE